MANSSPLSLRAYRFATSILEPAVPLMLNRRARRGKENRERISERLGFASHARPDGTLIWVHGASVGECLAVLPLIDELLREPDRAVLMTSGTVASAEMMAERLPPRAFHQFSPVDTPAAVARFIDHWRPAIGLFVDSEIWPNTLVAAEKSGVRLAMVNGRMSEKSFLGWQRAGQMAKSLLELFDMALVQDKETADRLNALGARNVEVTGSLKAESPPLPADADMLADLVRDIGGRPVFLATNTHSGEDELLLEVHDRLRRRFPPLLTIIAPRHAERGTEIAALSGTRTHALRSLGQKPDGNTEIYIADTMGELGLFYRLAPFAFVGKSLAAQGGQNPLEVARLGAAVLAGPHTDNFREAYDAIFAAQGSGRVTSVEELEALAQQLLSDPATSRAMGNAAEKAVAALGGALERTRAAVEEMLLAHART
jgi:3-deoxy-D-manno-octulosonic-acid transferase